MCESVDYGYVLYQAKVFELITDFKDWNFIETSLSTSIQTN